MNPTRRPLWCRPWAMAMAAAAAVGLASLLASWVKSPEPVYQGQPLSDWLRRFNNSDAATHRQAIAALRALGPAAVDRLTHDLLRPDPWLDRFGHAIIARIPGLKLHLDGAARHRIHAALVLDELGPDARAAIPALIRTIADPSRRVPPAIVQFTLLDIGPAAAGPLVNALDDAQEAVRQFATATLFALMESREIEAPTQHAALLPLTRRLRDPNPSERALAAQTLGRFGPRAGSATVALIAALNDPASEVRGQVAAALGEVEADPALAARPLINALADPAPAVRGNAALALGRFGSAALDAADPLAAALADSNETVRVNAANALGRIGTTTRAVEPALLRCLQDPTASVRASATTALGKLGSSAPGTLPALIEALKDADATVRSAAAKSLGKMGAAGAKAVPALTAALQDDQTSVRICAIEALGEIGPPAASATPALRRAQLNDFAGIGRYVAATLKRIHHTATSHDTAAASDREAESP